MVNPDQSLPFRWRPVQKKDIEIGGQWLSTYRLLQQGICNLVSVAEANSNVNTIIEYIMFQFLTLPSESTMESRTERRL